MSINGAPNNTVGGTEAGARNVISGNQDYGVSIANSGAQGNKVIGNYVGTDASGTKDLGNGFSGVHIYKAPNNTVGGTTAAERSVISHNGRGVYIDEAKGNRVMQNVISANDEEGVALYGNTATGNRILSNSIFNNGLLGIDLGEDGPTANDSRDADTGPNHLQNKPVLSSARNADGKTTVKGALHTRPIADLSYTIQFFSNPSGQNEGQKLIGQKVVKTDRSGNASFTFLPSSKVAAGRTITATATRNSNGDTSEFSAPKAVTTS